MTTNDNADPRLHKLERWIAGLPGPAVERIAPASADASFRRYFRVHRGGATQIAMDAPPEREGLDAWLRVARILAATGVHVPPVIAVDAEQGFVLMGDLGRQHYLESLGHGADPEPLYADAVDALVLMQSGEATAAAELPPYDRDLLMRELELFPEWFLSRHLALAPDEAERAVIAAAFDWLCDEALAQPVVLVHRDYHSRNLLVRPEGNPGIVDFQDAVRGPVTYDLVSLLKDCYVVWPRKRLLAWLDRYREAAAARPAFRWAPSARNSCAGSTAWDCSAISRCSASSRDCGTATASPGTSATCRACSTTRCKSPRRSRNSRSSTRT